MTERARLSQPFTPAEERAVTLLAEGLTYKELAEAIGATERTARQHITNAGAKVPGDLPLQLRVVAWFRGGDTWKLPQDQKDDD